MDKKFLHRVIDQIVYETKIGYNKSGGRIDFPFYSFPFKIPDLYHHIDPSIIPPFLGDYFSNHCKDVYGLNDDEVKYVWNRYEDIINYKIESNG
jgi:hypothetical protein